MNGITGIEIGPDACVLVRARARGDGIELSAAHILQAERSPNGPFPPELLRRVRHERRFPALAHVVTWTLADRDSAANRTADPALRPLIAAGFRVEVALSPQAALSALASQRPRDGAVAWVVVNRNGGATAVVRRTDTLYSHAFRWAWGNAAIGSQAQLLQRYTIVAHLAPEIRRAVDNVRAKHGATVQTVVTCGDLPDLRSLTMPLIEELDLEVETLDSAEGLVIVPSRRDQLPDSLAALRLACGAVAASAPQTVVVSSTRLALGAALVAIAAALLSGLAVWWMRPDPARVLSRITVPHAVTPPTTQRPEVRPPDSTSGVGNAPTRTTGTIETTPAPDDSRDASRASQSQRAPVPLAPVTRTAPAPRVVRPTELTDPLPVIDTILVSSDRRIAVIDGAIVGVGDLVGRRTVVGIEPEAVFLKEPSGREVRVPIRVRRTP